MVVFYGIIKIRRDEFYRASLFLCAILTHTHFCVLSGGCRLTSNSCRLEVGSKQKREQVGVDNSVEEKKKKKMRKRKSEKQ